MTQEAIETIDLTEEIDFARTVAREAATIAMTFYVGSSDVKYKSGNEPVTEADRSANNHIVKRVREVFPEDGILSEESKDDLSRLEKDRVWIIDPLDGTKEFIARNGEFSIMIGLAVRPRAGVGRGHAAGGQSLVCWRQGRAAHIWKRTARRIPLHVSDTT